MDKHQLLELLKSLVISSNSVSFHRRDAVFLEVFNKQILFTYKKIDDLNDQDLFWLHENFEDWLSVSKQPNPFKIHLYDKESEKIMEPMEEFIHNISKKR